MWLIEYVGLGLITGIILLLACRRDVKYGAVINYKQLIFSALFFPIIWIEVIFFGINFLAWRMKKHGKSRE